jgi:hypothetical protein
MEEQFAESVSVVARFLPFSALKLWEDSAEPPAIRSTNTATAAGTSDVG